MASATMAPRRTGSPRPPAWHWLIHERGAAVLGGLGTLVVLMRLFVPSSIGLADNGDGPRLMCQFGLSPHLDGAKPYNEFAIFRYDVGGCPPGVDYPSSSRLLIGVNTFFSGLSGLPGTDLRVTGVLYALLAGLLIAFTVRVLRSLASRVIVTVALTLVLAEAAFADYMASPFTETAAIVGILILTVAGFYVGRAGPSRLLAIVLFTVGGTLSVTAKVQTVTLAVPIVIFLIVQICRRGAHQGRLERLVARALLVSAVVAVVGAAQWTYSNNPREFDLINPTEVIFGSLLGPSDDPHGDLREMGLPVELAKYQGHSWWNDGPQHDPLFVTVQDKMTYQTAARFYLGHPGRALTTVNSAANDLFKGRPVYLGTYAPGSGKAGELECRVCAVSGALGLLSGTGLFGLVGVWIGLAFASVRGVRSRHGDPPSRDQHFWSMGLLLVGIAVVAFLTAAFGESTETTKHLIFAILATSLAVVCCVAPVVSPLDTSSDSASARSRSAVRRTGRHRGSPARGAGRPAPGRTAVTDVQE